MLLLPSPIEVQTVYWPMHSPSLMYQGLKAGAGPLADAGKRGVVMAGSQRPRQGGRGWTLAGSGRIRLQEMGRVVGLRRGCGRMGAGGGRPCRGWRIARRPRRTPVASRSQVRPHLHVSYLEALGKDTGPRRGTL